MKEELIKMARDKDEIAFNKIVEDHIKELYSIAKSRLKQYADVEDAVQETLLDMYKNLWCLKEEKYFKCWIVKILINNCNDIIRNQGGIVLCFDDNFIERVPDTNNRCTQLEENQDFFNLISFLSAQDQTIMTMRYSQEYGINEISQILKIKEGTIRMRISRIKEKIRERYQEKDEKSFG